MVTCPPPLNLAYSGPHLQVIVEGGARVDVQAEDLAEDLAGASPWVDEALELVHELVEAHGAEVDPSHKTTLGDDVHEVLHAYMHWGGTTMTLRVAFVVGCIGSGRLRYPNARHHGPLKGFLLERDDATVALVHQAVVHPTEAVRVVEHDLVTRLSLVVSRAQGVVLDL